MGQLAIGERVLRDDSTAVFLSREGAEKVARRISDSAGGRMAFSVLPVRRRGENIGWKLVDGFGVEVTEDRAAGAV